MSGVSSSDSKWCEALFVTKIAWGSEALDFGISELASEIDFAQKIVL